MTKVRLAAGARDYLRKETAYLRRHSPAAAAAFAARMAEARRNLARFPDLGFGPDRLPVPGSRRPIVGDYLLDYDVGSDGILVTSIRHGAIRPPGLEAEDDFDYEAV